LASFEFYVVRLLTGASEVRFFPGIILDFLSFCFAFFWILDMRSAGSELRQRSNAQPKDSRGLRLGDRRG